MFKKNKNYVFSVEKYKAWAMKKNVRDFIIELKLEMIADKTPVNVVSSTFGYCQRQDFKEMESEVMPIWCDEVAE